MLAIQLDITLLPCIVIVNFLLSDCIKLVFSQLSFFIEKSYHSLKYL